MDLLQQLMAMSMPETSTTQPPQEGLYTDIMTGVEYPTLESYLDGRRASDHRRMGIIGADGSSVATGAFSGGFSGGFA